MRITNATKTVAPTLNSALDVPSKRYPLQPVAAVMAAPGSIPAFPYLYRNLGVTFQRRFYSVSDSRYWAVAWRRIISSLRARENSRGVWTP